MKACFSSVIIFTITYNNLEGYKTLKNGKKVRIVERNLGKLNVNHEG
jgi:hypothetical protein